MIIDVVDLNFETLRFNKRYDPTRYRRGTNIYNKGLVEVETVNKIDEKNYSIEASVEGNYDTYTTRLEICGNMINKSTCTCEDYHKGNLCKHIIATSMEVIEPHYASTIQGRRKIEERKKEEERKRLEETINSLDLSELYESTSELRNRKVGNLATSIKLEFFLEIEDSQIIFDYIIKYAEMVEYNNKHNSYATANSLNKVIYLSGNDIDDFFNINKNKEILLNPYSGNTKYEFTN